jgi:hypothetical protein
MADFKLAPASEKHVWSTKFLSDYVRTSGFVPYMGTGDTSIIRVNKDLTGQNGTTVHIPYYGALTGGGVTGDTPLIGAEEAMANYSIGIKATLRRHAVAVTENEKFKTDLDIANQARSALRDNRAQALKLDLIKMGTGVVVQGSSADADGNYAEDIVKAFADASTGERNAYITANSDRVLFGASKSNNTGTFSTSAANVDASADKLSAATLNLAKSMALSTTSLAINPYRTDDSNGRETFVLFVNTEGYRDLFNDPTIYAANKDARPRDVESNPIFQSGDLIWNGIVIKCIPSIGVLSGVVGASSVPVGNAMLCGANALGVAWAKLPEPRVDTRDYGHVHGLGILEIRGQTKMSVKGVQTGMVNIFHASQPDA